MQLATYDIICYWLYRNVSNAFSITGIKCFYVKPFGTAGFAKTLC